MTLGQAIAPTLTVVICCASLGCLSGVQRRSGCEDCDARVTRSLPQHLVRIADAGGATCPSTVADPNDGTTFPLEVTIAVDQTVTVQYQEAGYCFGGAPTENDYRPVATHWTTADSLIITVDSLIGTITGRAVGEARVSPTNAPALSVAIHVR